MKAIGGSVSSCRTCVTASLRRDVRRLVRCFAPGLVAMGAAILAFAYIHLPPLHSLAVEPNQFPRLVLFATSTLFVVSLTAAQRVTAESLTQAHDDLGTAGHPAPTGRYSRMKARRSGLMRSAWIVNAPCGNPL